MEVTVGYLVALLLRHSRMQNCSFLILNIESSIEELASDMEGYLTTVGDDEYHNFMTYQGVDWSEVWSDFSWEKTARMTRQVYESL